MDLESIDERDLESIIDTYKRIEGDDAYERRKQLASLSNKESLVTNEERSKVETLNAKLKPEIPKKTPRYQSVAETLEIKLDRVRYIIEGPRR